MSINLPVRKVLGTGMPGLVLFALSALAGACGDGKDGEGNFPKNVAFMSDSQKVAYVMRKAKPDSVARFICNASLGKVPGVKIDTLANATLYAYEHYKDADLQTFSAAFDEYTSSLPLNEKMMLHKLAADKDPMQMGYELGLEYVNDIRVNHKDEARVEQEIAALKRVCSKNPEDSLTFVRFMKGFKVALDYDKPGDIPRRIYEKYK